MFGSKHIALELLQSYRSNSGESIDSLKALDLPSFISEPKTAPANFLLLIISTTSLVSPILMASCTTPLD